MEDRSLNLSRMMGQKKNLKMAILIPSGKLLHPLAAPPPTIFLILQESSTSYQLARGTFFETITKVFSTHNFHKITLLSTEKVLKNISTALVVGF